MHVDDVVSAIGLALEAGGRGLVLDVGSGKARSVVDFAKLIVEVADSESTVVSIPRGRQSEGFEHPVAQVARTYAEIGWEPADDDDAIFEERIAEAVQWYQARLTSAVP